MKYIIEIIIVLLCSNYSYAQFYGISFNQTNILGGHNGIGIANPVRTLHIYNQNANNIVLGGQTGPAYTPLEPTLRLETRDIGHNTNYAWDFKSTSALTITGPSNAIMSLSGLGLSVGNANGGYVGVGQHTKIGKNGTHQYLGFGINHFGNNHRELASGLQGGALIESDQNGNLTVWTTNSGSTLSGILPSTQQRLTITNDGTTSVKNGDLSVEDENFLVQNGKVGIGTSAGTERVIINGDTKVTNGNVIIEDELQNGATNRFLIHPGWRSTHAMYIVPTQADLSPNFDRALSFQRDGLMRKSIDGNQVAFAVNNTTLNGSVTDKDVFRVLGNGLVYAQEIKVQLAPFPDYVFEKDYPLMPLSELGAYIQKNKHLPNIPSAQEVATDGVGVGALQLKQMEKIEELTLYMLQMNERLEQLEKENAALKASLNRQ